MKAKDLGKNAGKVPAERGMEGEGRCSRLKKSLQCTISAPPLPEQKVYCKIIPFTVVMQ